MNMFKDVREEVTYVPSDRPVRSEGQADNKERQPASVLESIFWQTTGWVHTPPHIKAQLGSVSKFEIPKSFVEDEKYKSYTKKSFAPKLQIEDKVPYGGLPKDIVSDIEKRRFARQDLKAILEGMGIQKDVILPPVLFHKGGMEIFKADYVDGIPQQPFLDLDMFDDSTYYDAHSPEEWLSLGDSESGRKPLPALAFIPQQKTSIGCLKFDWYKVKVFDYFSDKLYFVRRNLDDQVKETSDDYESDLDDLWIPRICLKFDPEEPLKFAKRLQNAVISRHIVEENLRMNYYIECMPLDDSPDCPKEDLDSIIETAKSSRLLQSKSQWINDRLKKNVKEIQLQYKRAYNYTCYTEIAGQSPDLLKNFKNESLVEREIYRYPSSKIEMLVPFADVFERFRCKTVYTSIEVIRALRQIERNILRLRGMSLYNLSESNVLPLHEFETLQTTALSQVSKYIRETWISAISQAILQNMENCRKGHYDLNQTVIHTFKLNKLGNLLKAINLKMQDVIRFSVVESLKKYAELFYKACSTVLNVDNKFEWTDGLCSNRFGSLGNPILEVPLDINGDSLRFIVTLQQHVESVNNLFDEGLRVTKDLPRIEKLVMKKMLYDPDDKLDSVEETEKHILGWKANMNDGLNKAITVAETYIGAYDDILESCTMDKKKYVKELAQEKTDCEELKKIIEKHNAHILNLATVIPSHVDIGPFRLATKNVRQAVIKKHEQLADAVLNYYYTKLRQNMETINEQFQMLIGRIEKATVNVEDFVEKRQWCRTVPNKIENLCVYINRIRSDVKFLSTLHRNMGDEDFNTFWQIQKLPQESFSKLQQMIEKFDDEKAQHKENLTEDQQKLGSNLKSLRSTISAFAKQWDLEKTSGIAAEVRNARQSIEKFIDLSQLYQKREKLLRLPITDYSKIQDLSQSLVPYENFWLTTDQLNKYKKKDDADLMSIDASLLREKMESFRSDLKSSLEHFDEKKFPEIHESITKVSEDLEDFIATRLQEIFDT